MISPREEIADLMAKTSAEIVECMRVALATGALAQSVVVVKLCPGDVAAVMLCDRAQVLKEPPAEILATQYAMLEEQPKEDEILILIFSKTCKGVGRVTSEQARRFTLRRTN